MTAIGMMGQYWPGFSAELREVINAAYARGLADGKEAENLQHGGY